ncbi:TPA_asm: nucleoprotein [finepatterned puffer bornavirus]|uniref:Nucleoprotein n=1 Tax=finepatterned puffer bornavirus TaxID=3055758 RepID=A0AA48P913_9MONO|nr:TPA_asm: nucleoprotein [finepatterned puffer bornavirus]
MASMTLEIEDDVGAEICLPPQAEVNGYVARSIDDPSSAIATTKGGVIALLISILLVCFPQLYALRKIMDRVSPKRGVIIPERGETKWCGPNDKMTPVQILKALKMCLTLLYYLIKNPSKQPTTQVSARFSAMYIELRKGTPPAVPIEMGLDYPEAASWLSSQIGLPTLFTFLVKLQNDPSCGATGRALINQVVMVARHADMTPYLTIVDYLAADPTRSALLPGVGREAAEFRQMEKDLKEKHNHDFPFIKVLSLEGHERLSAQNYPNLFAVAIKYKSKHDRTFAAYAAKKSAACNLSDDVIQESLTKPIKRKAICNEADKDHVRKIFMIDPDALQSEESPNEALLTKLLAQMTGAQSTP